MKNSPNSHFQNTLAQLEKRYSCSQKDWKRLKQVGYSAICKISHTEYGGFESRTESYLKDELSHTFKIKIDYIDQQTRACKKLFLVPITRE